METIREFAATRFGRIFNAPIDQSGETVIRLWSTVEILPLIVAVIVVSWAPQRSLISKVLPRTRLEEGTQFVITPLVGYLVVVFGLLVLIQTAGVDLGDVQG